MAEINWEMLEDLTADLSDEQILDVIEELVSSIFDENIRAKVAGLVD